MIKDQRYLMLLLTTECNLRCSYCYRDDESIHQVMSRELAAEALSFISRTDKHVHVQMTGGEPALVPELIEWIASEIRNKAGRPVTIGVQTNGTLIDAALIEIFKKYNIQVGVSLDGPVSIQEELRGNAAETLKGLKLLSDYGVPFRVTTVVTRQNVAALGKLALLLSGFRTVMGLGLDLLVHKGRAMKDKAVSSPSAEELRHGLLNLMKRLKQVNTRRLHPIRLRELDLIKQSDNRGAPFFCHASNGESIAVHPDGTIYPCTQTVGDPYFCCGTLDSPDESRLSLVGNYVLEGYECSSCVFKGHCPGDCPSRQYYNDKTSAQLACVMYRTFWGMGNKVGVRSI